MKKYLLGIITLFTLLWGFSSCKKNEINVLQIRWGIVEDGNPGTGNANVNYYALKDVYEAVNQACMKCGGANYIKSESESQAMINVVVRKEVESKIAFITNDAKKTIESATLPNIFTNRTFRIEYRYGNEGDWIQAYEYIYPKQEK